MRWLLLALLLLAGPAAATIARDNDDWTVVTASGDSRIVYVSSSDGDDADSGLTEALAKATIAAGKALMRDDMPDHLLLKKGDSWTTGFGTWNLDGRSATEPMLIGAYGTGARPKLKTDATSGCIISNVAGSVDFVAIIGIECYSTTRDPASPDYAVPVDNPIGIYWRTSNWFLLEDCKISFYGDQNLLLQGVDPLVVNAPVVRRNIITDAYGYDLNGPLIAPGVPHSQGIFACRVNDLVLEENLFDHNGYLVRETVQDVGGATIFNHNVYLCGGYEPNQGPTTFQRNISANASSHGFHRPPGGPVVNNLFIDNPLVAVSFATNPDRATVYALNVTDGAVDLETVDDPNLVGTDQNPRGTGLTFQVGPTLGIFINRNLFLHVDHTLATNDRGLSVNCCADDPDTDGECPTPGTGCTNISVIGNVWYDWDKGCPKVLRGTIADENFQNNIYWDTASQCVPTGTNKNGETYVFYDSTRDVATYNSIMRGGAATKAAFIAAARLQSRDSWDPTLKAVEVNNWIRKGFFASRQHLRRRVLWR